MREVDMPGTVTGKGDDVVLLCCKTLDTAVITGNKKKSSFFHVGMYYDTGNDFFADGVNYDTGYFDLVNTTVPYKGTVLFEANSKAVLEIQAVDDWSIDVKTK